MLVVSYFNHVNDEFTKECVCCHLDPEYSESIDGLVFFNSMTPSRNARVCHLCDLSKSLSI